MDPGAVLLALLGSPNLASRRSVYERYDSTVGTDTVVGPGHGAAVMRIKGTTRALVATTDGNAAVGALDPYLGAAMSVAEATRNVSITGARPLGVTNCLNYGDPTRPEAFWQLSEGVRGLGDACRALGLPVTGGNVSLYNESPAGAIAPTPEIGVVGLIDDVALLAGPAFVDDGDTIVLVGEATSGLVGSAYAALAGTTVEDGLPSLDLAREAAVQAFVRDAIDRGLVNSAQDVSGGGLAVALAEAAMWGGVGASVRVPTSMSPAVELFGEGPSRHRRHRDGAPRAGADAARPPARPARGGARRRRRRSTPDPARRHELDRRLGGAWQHDRRCARCPRHGASARLGPRLGPRPRLGRRLSDVRRVRGGASRR